MKDLRLNNHLLNKLMNLRKASRDERVLISVGISPEDF